MIRGLEHFKARFEQFSNDFILIGGVASHLQLEDAGAMKVRATKDLDIVLAMRPSNEFLRELREYIHDGGYEISKGDGERQNFYRFQKPQDKEFPLMIELFSIPDIELELFGGQQIIPISTPEDVESLSAILLDDEYFEVVQNNIKEGDGLNLLDTMGLIPLKAKAYIDIKGRGGDSREWKKHRSDILNLAVNFLDGQKKEILKGRVKDDFIEFISELEKEITSDIVKGACGEKVEVEEILQILRYGFIS